METNRIHGQTIELNLQEMRLFGAPSMSPMIGEVHAGAVMNGLASRRQNIESRLRACSITDWFVGRDERRLNRKVELFVPVATEILQHEVDIYLDKQAAS